MKRKNGNPRLPQIETYNIEELLEGQDLTDVHWISEKEFIDLKMPVEYIKACGLEHDCRIIRIGRHTLYDIESLYYSIYNQSDLLRTVRDTVEKYIENNTDITPDIEIHKF